MKREVSAIGLLLILVFPATGYYGWIQIRKVQVRKEVREIISGEAGKEELVLLRFSLEEAAGLLRWEHPGEFEFGGEMYDVVERRVTGDSVCYWCWWDRKETDLNKQLGHWSGKHHETDLPLARDHSRLSTHMFTPFIAAAAGQVRFMPRAGSGVTVIAYNHYQSICTSPPDPPPWSLPS